MPFVGGPESGRDRVIHFTNTQCVGQAPPIDIAVLYYESGNVSLMCPCMERGGRCPHNAEAEKCPHYLELERVAI